MTNENTLENSFSKMDKITDFTNSKIFPYISLLIITLSIILVYSNIYDNSIHFDDEFIFKNKSLHDPNNFEELFSINKFRLVPFWTFALNYVSSDSGKDLGGFYTFNVIIHIINSAFAFLISLLIFKTPVIRDTKIAKYGVALAFLIGLMFALHPLQTQAVTYIYQRLASIAATFYYGSILTYLAGRLIKKGFAFKAPLFILSFIFLILGLFSKENVFTIFPMILIIELLLFNKNFKLSPAVIGVFVGLIVVGLFIFLQFQVPSNIFAPIVNFNGETVTSSNYLITQFKVLPLYLRLFVVPFGQNFDHDIRVSDSFFDFGVLAGFAVIALVIGFALYMYKYNRLITFGVLWFFLTIAVESSIIPIADVVFEHRVYLPMLGLLLALVAGLYELVSKREKLLPYLLIFLFVVASFNGVLANQRNNVWQDEITFWSDAISKSPDKARVYFKRGQAYIANNKVNPALADFSKTIELRPEFISAYTYRAAIYVSLSKNQEAIEDYNKFIELSQDKAQGYLNRARVWNLMKFYSRSINDFTEYLKINKNDVNTYIELATVYETINDATNAIKTVRAAIKADETNPKAIYALGRYLFMKGDFDEAMTWVNKALESPKLNKNIELDATITKGNIYFFKKDYTKALEEFDKAYAIKPDYKPLLIGYALLYRTQGNYRKELEYIDQVVRIEKNNDDNWLARGICNINLKDYEAADKDLRTALQINRLNKEANMRHASIMRFLK